MSVLDAFNLTGKRALITGGSRGLGKSIALALAEAGADLVLVGKDGNNLKQAQTELGATGRKIDVLEADLFLPMEVDKMCTQALETCGPIDILFNNVGGRRENVKLEDQPIADWLRLMDLNLTSTMVCTKRLAPPMIQRGWGRVVNVASVCGTIVGRNIHGRHYETSKAAVVGFTRSMAVDWARTGVTVNAIAPGGFMTDANRRWFKERPEFQTEIQGYIPMGRLGEPHEMGPLAVYLASDASSYMTGSVVTIDGGWTLW